MDESLAVSIARVPVTTVQGTWFRHAFAAYPERALDGRVYDGRWGTKPGFPVLYLGRPPASVIVEAYRHMVDPVEDPALIAQIHPRLFVTADVGVTDVLDLRTAGARATAGLTIGDLHSGIDEYGACQRIAQVAHQLGRHGIIAPAATDMGETLALFTDLTDAAGQRPVRSADRPAAPRCGYARDRSSSTPASRAGSPRPRTGSSPCRTGGAGSPASRATRAAPRRTPEQPSPSQSPICACQYAQIGSPRPSKITDLDGRVARRPTPATPTSSRSSRSPRYLGAEREKLRKSTHSTESATLRAARSWCRGRARPSR